MRTGDLFVRAVLCAAAFIVYSLQYQYASLIDGRSITSNRHLRSVPNKEEMLLQNMNQMPRHPSRMEESRLKEMRGFTSRLQGRNLQSSAKNSDAHSSIPLDDPCHYLRASNSSLAILAPYAGACKHPFVSELGYPPKPLSIATIIPGLARGKDAAFIPAVLRSLQTETVASSEVVIAISGVYDRVGVRYRHRMDTIFSKSDTKKASNFCSDLLKDLQKVYTKSPLKLLCIGERLSSGRARNAAIAASNSEILAFIDSDDTVYPIRNEVIQNVFNDSMPCRREHREAPLQMFLHSHKIKEYKQHPYEKARGYHLPPTSKVLPGGNWTGEQCLEQEDGLDVQNGRQLLVDIGKRPSEWKIHYDLANGHPVIRRSVFDKVHFSSIPKGQDIILLRDLLFTMTPFEAEQSVLFLNRPLTTYYVAGNANADLRQAE